MRDASREAVHTVCGRRRRHEESVMDKIDIVELIRHGSLGRILQQGSAEVDLHFRKVILE